MIDLDRAAAAAAGGQHERPLLVLVKLKLPVRTIIAANPGRTYYSTINHSFTCCLHQAAALQAIESFFANVMRSG